MEVCRIESQGSTYVFQRDDAGEGNWICVKKNHRDSASIGINQILHRALQNELNRVAVTEHKIETIKLARFLTKEKKPVKTRLSPMQRKAVGKFIKIFK